MPHANAQLLTHFYTAFAGLDAEGMAACYAPQARFRDEVFELDGRDEIASMWRMLCTAVRTKGRDVWSLEFSGIDADAHRGRAHWEAHYRFSATGRLVHNRIESQFEFRDGLIVAQIDSFDFWAWSRQALGAPGWLLGWTPLLRKKVRAQAAVNLSIFRAQQK